MFDVHGPTEHLNAIVLVVRHLDVVHDRAAADALKGDAIPFIVRTELDSCELHADEAQDPAVVVRVRAAVNAGVPFAEPDATREVQR